VLAPSHERVEPPCPHVRAGCGGCTWQHVTRAGQLAAKQAIVGGALRGIDGLVVEPIADPGPPLGWRRRARFHVEAGRVGLYALASARLVPVEPTGAPGAQRCLQLEPQLDAALGAVIACKPPDGELCLVRAHTGDVVVGVARAWPAASALLGRHGIVGVVAGDRVVGQPIVELEPGLWGGPFDFAQASAAGNAALVEVTRGAVGRGPGALLELFAGAGNLTRAFVEDGWDVVATDAQPPVKPIAGARFETGDVARVLGRVSGPFDAVVLDPPRTGLGRDECMALAALAAPLVVYVSCDPATLARDLSRLAHHGYRAERAWPLDLMPQTAHVELVVRVRRGARQAA
jgi:23S rRNA (uracil1939-C5)-methyltransferase